MKNPVTKVVRAGGRSGMLGLVYVLPLIPLSCPAGVRAAEGATVVVETPPVKGTTYSEAPAAAAAFREFHRILKGYPDLAMEPERVRNAGKTPEQFEKDVAAYVLKEDESGYIRMEEGDYDNLVREMKILHHAVSRISEKAEVLHNTLMRFARKSVQTALNNEAYMGDSKLTPEKAEEFCRAFSLEMLRMFAQDLLAFRCHASWLEEDVQGESVNRASRSIAVKQYLSCNGNNGEIVMSTDAAHQLWLKQVEMEEANLFALSDSGESACYTDSISRAEWSAPGKTVAKEVAALKQEWAGVKTAYNDYMEAWAAAYAPVPGYSGSGAPYWRADMCMHMLSHWEELVSYMLFRNKSRLNAENMDCFLLSLPGKEADDFANVYIKKLSIALKLLEGEAESEILDVETEAEYLREHVARLYDARMRCAIAGISCEFYGDKKRIAEVTEKARKHIRESLLQDIKEICRMGAEKVDRQQCMYGSVSGLELWRKQMRLLLTEIGKSYEYAGNPEPFSGEKNPAAPEFSDTHVKRIQDLLEETDAAWNWYRRSWILLSCNLSAVDIYSEYPLHVQREQWLKDLYHRVYTQKSTEEEMDTES